MGQILRHWRIYTAALFSVVVVVGAYELAKSVEVPQVAQASAETALLQVIASKDSDGDGLPDWEETLYGADPQNPDSFGLNMTDGEAVAKGLIVPKAIADVPAAPTTSASNNDIDYKAYGLTAPTEGTLTDAFAKNFFTLYLSAKQANGGTDLSPTDTNAIASQALDALSASITSAPDFKSANDLTVSGAGQDALRAFAINAETVLRKNTSTATTSELIYLQYLVNGNDATAGTQLASIAKAYRDSAAGLAALSVPSELATAHLALVNALMRVSEVVGDFARVNTDPLTAMIALQQYVPAAQNLGEAFIDVGTVYRNAGIVLNKDMPGASFVNLIGDMEARLQATAKKP